MDYRSEKDSNVPRRYHIGLRIKLCERTKTVYRFDTDRRDAPGFVNDLFDFCDGIISVTVTPHTLSVSHHSMFTWSELLPNIVEILRINLASEDRIICDLSSRKRRTSYIALEASRQQIPALLSGSPSGN